MKVHQGHVALQWDLELLQNPSGPCSVVVGPGAGAHFAAAASPAGAAILDEICVLKVENEANLKILRQHDWRQQALQVVRDPFFLREREPLE